MKQILEELKNFINQNSFYEEQDFFDSILAPNNDKMIYVDDILNKIKELEKEIK